MDGELWADRTPRATGLERRRLPGRKLSEGRKQAQPAFASPKVTGLRASNVGLGVGVNGMRVGAGHNLQAPVSASNVSAASRERSAGRQPRLSTRRTSTEAFTRVSGRQSSISTEASVDLGVLRNLSSKVTPIDRQYEKASSDYDTIMSRHKERGRPRMPHERENRKVSAGSRVPTSTLTSARSPSARGSGTTRLDALPPLRGKKETVTPAWMSPNLKPKPAAVQPSAAQPSVASTSAKDSDEETTATGYQSAPEGSAVGQVESKRKRGRIRVAVRKRPLLDEFGEDVILVNSPNVQVDALKQRVDLSEYTESHSYAFDDAFDENQKNDDVYASCGKNLIDTVFEGGSASCFAYGQTGSGKTYTMIGGDTEPGLYILAARDIFERVKDSHRVFVSFYEIYCNSLFDLLNQRAAVRTLEDANKRINVCGLTWHEVGGVRDLLRVIERGMQQRRTGSTSANEFSSRSHAVMTITLRDEDQPKFLGSLNIVDLAGSERAADTQANDKQTRLEGAEINKSLLALKECIRGLDERHKHIPFRGSKLTEVLRDSFIGNSRTVMIANISPAADNSEHTLNTLRYAFRVKGLSIASIMPSKERNAPRPSQRRAKSEAAREVTKKDKKKKKSSKWDVDVLSAKNRLKKREELIGDIQRMQSEMEQLKGMHQADEAKIKELLVQNERLASKLQGMQDVMGTSDL